MSSPASGKQRNATTDYMRLVAAIAIVWFHSGLVGHRITYLGLPYFLFLLGLPSRSTVSQRAQRLLVPFVVWSMIYACLQAATALHHGRAPFSWWQPSMIWLGTVIPLWFLPFAFVSQVALRDIRSRAFFFALPVIAAILSIATSGVAFPGIGQWSFALVPVAVGFAFFRVGPLAILSFGVAVILLFTFRDSRDNLTIALGSALSILIVTVAKLPETDFSRWCARVSLPLYLVHPLVLSISYKMDAPRNELAIFSLIGSVVFATMIDRLRNYPLARALGG